MGFEPDLGEFSLALEAAASNAPVVTIGVTKIKMGTTIKDDRSISTPWRVASREMTIIPRTKVTMRSGAAINQTPNPNPGTSEAMQHIESPFYSDRTLVVNLLHDRPRSEFFHQPCRTKQDKDIAETAFNCAC
jgi:hypothetical protein